jgi:hypothetical protein
VDVDHDEEAHEDEGRDDEGRDDEGRDDEGRDDEALEVEPSGPDIREVAASEPVPVGKDHLRVPTADETSAAVEKANRALAEIRAREEADAKEEAEHRAEQLTSWQARDEEVETHDEFNEPVPSPEAETAYDLDDVDA